MPYNIFISYRRDGGEVFAQLLYDRLVQQGYSVFYDVSSLRSGRYDQKLYKYLDECQDALIILSPHALERCSVPDDWVAKEISYLIQNNKNIIPIILRGFDFPSILPDTIKDLPNYNALTVGNMQSFSWFIEQLTSKFLISDSTIERKAISRVDYNVDSEFLKIFNGDFGDITDKESLDVSQEISELTKRIEKKQKEYANKQFFKQQDLVDKTDKESLNASKETSEHKNVKTLIPKEYVYNPEIPAKIFSLDDAPGNKTIIYEEQINVDPARNVEYLSPVVLHSTKGEIDQRGYIKREYCIINPEEDNNLVFITMTKNGVAYVRSGKLIGDIVRIGKDPLIVKMSKNITSYLINESAVDTSHMSENNHIVRFVEAEANLNSEYVVIDPDSQEPVLREPYYDEETKEWKAKTRLEPHKSYFVFGISYKSGEEYRNLSPFEIARNIAYGIWGYQKDLLKGMSLLEKENSPEALYTISQLLFDEMEIQDETLAMQYLKKAASKGNLNAIADYFSIYLLNGGTFQLEDFLKHTLDKESAVYWFFMGVAQEMKEAENNTLVVDYYYQSAQKGYKAAQYRLSSYASSMNGKNWTDHISQYEASTYYSMTLQLNTGEFEYCLGAVLIYGLGIESTSRTRKAGLDLLDRSIREGNVSALHEVHDYYEYIEPASMSTFQSKYAELLKSTK